MTESEQAAVQTETVEDPTLTCRQGACVPGHPLHCCHTSVSQRAWASKKIPYSMFFYHKCVDCGQESRNQPIIRVDKFGRVLAT